MPASLHNKTPPCTGASARQVHPSTSALSQSPSFVSLTSCASFAVMKKKNAQNLLRTQLWLSCDHPQCFLTKLASDTWESGAKLTSYISFFVSSDIESRQVLLSYWRAVLTVLKLNNVLKKRIQEETKETAIPWLKLSSHNKNSSQHQPPDLQPRPTTTHSLLSAAY